MDATENPRPPLRLLNVMAIFLRLGAIGFGGGMAVVALMEHELIKKRRLLDHD